jgi:hypothetical protein
MDKKRGAVIIKNWWWEAEVTPSEPMKFEIRQCFQRFLQYLGADRLELDGQPREQAGLEWLGIDFS